MTKTIALPAMQAESNLPVLKYLLFFALLAGVLFSLAHAGGDETAVDDIWRQLSGWARGAPGKIIALLSFLSAVWFGIVKPNYTNAIGSIVFCLMMANATEIIENFMQASA
ncbi:MAG: TraA family conjugative transfer protein [Aeromonas popoffii]|uniref:TraA family conjugative transfer protein n=1 Tax=Aeromonas popoffii TaxID=70856 RepID=UPI003F3B095D